MLSNPFSELSITVNLHGLKMTFQTPDAVLRERFEVVYGHLPRLKDSESDVVIEWHIHDLPTAPLPSAEMSVISEDNLVNYYGSDTLIAMRLPKYGLIMVDLTQKRLRGTVTPRCLTAYGVFEDVMMISLAPLYRRRGWFPLHAFAALGPDGRAALITGNMGSGKTTTGLALLNVGWKLLSNDSPLLTLKGDQVQVLAYPGQLSAFADSLARFENLKHFMSAESSPSQISTAPDREKHVFQVEQAFNDPWATSGPAGGVFFPKVVPGLTHSELVEISAKEALLQLMPQGVEGWDKPVIGQSLQLLGRLVAQAPCYLLRLSPQMEQLPGVIAAGMVNG